MPGWTKRRDLDVVVLADSSKPEGYRLELREDGQTTNYVEFGKDDDNLYAAGHHMIVFKIDDQVGSGLRFPSNVKDAMWVGALQGGSGPNQPSYLDQFKARRVSQNGKKLVVRNDNDTPEELGFTLRMVKIQRGQEIWVELDPAVGNRDGGSQLLFATLSPLQAVIVGGLIVLAGAAAWLSAGKRNGERRRKR